MASRQGLPLFSRKELRELCGWSLTQVRVHLERLVELEYLALRHGRMGSRSFMNSSATSTPRRAVAHIGLIDVETTPAQLQNQPDGFFGGGGGAKRPPGGGWRNRPPPAWQPCHASRLERNLTAWRNRTSGALAHGRCRNRNFASNLCPHPKESKPLSG